MRQIKFRGKRTDGVWVYGTNVYIPIKDKWKTRINGSRVDPETIGQFTGLHDRNGKDIYEGDLIRDDEFTYVVYWMEDVAAFMVEEYHSECDAPKIFLLSDFGRECEVVGNIHNPDCSCGKGGAK